MKFRNLEHLADAINNDDYWPAKGKFPTFGGSRPRRRLAMRWQPLSWDEHYVLADDSARLVFIQRSSWENIVDEYDNSDDD